MAPSLSRKGGFISLGVHEAYSLKILLFFFFVIFFYQQNSQRAVNLFSLDRVHRGDNVPEMSAFFIFYFFCQVHFATSLLGSCLDQRLC